MEKRFNDYDFPSNYFDLISTQFALPSASSDDFPKLWSRISDALKHGVVFTGQLFGLSDDWSTRADMTFHSTDAIHRLTREFEEILVEEKEYTEDEARQKHWHFYNLILRKK